MRKSLLKIYRTDYLILMISMILCCFWFLFAFPQPSTGQNSPGQDRAELQEIQNNQVKKFFPSKWKYHLQNNVYPHLPTGSDKIYDLQKNCLFSPSNWHDGDLQTAKTFKLTTSTDLLVNYKNNLQNLESATIFVICKKWDFANRSAPPTSNKPMIA